MIEFARSGGTRIPSADESRLRAALATANARIDEAVEDIPAEYVDDVICAAVDVYEGKSVEEAAIGALTPYQLELRLAALQVQVAILGSRPYDEIAVDALRDFACAAP